MFTLLFIFKNTVSLRLKKSIPIPEIHITSSYSFYSYISSSQQVIFNDSFFLDKPLSPACLRLFNSPLSPDSFLCPSHGLLSERVLFFCFVTALCRALNILFSFDPSISFAFFLNPAPSVHCTLPASHLFMLVFGQVSEYCDGTRYCVL